MNQSLMMYLMSIEFINHVFSTLVIFISGLVLSYVLCFILIALGFRFKILRQIIYSVILFVQPVPRIVIFPLLLLFLGINDLSRIVLITLGLFFSNYLILDSKINELKISPLHQILKIYRVTFKKQLIEYYLKGCAASLHVSYRNSVGYGLTLTVIAESSFSNRGLGYLIWRHWERFEMPELYMVVILISVIALILNSLPWLFLRIKKYIF